MRRSWAFVLGAIVMSIITRNHTIFAVEDVEVSRAFYIEKLGFAETMQTGGWSFLKRGSLRLRIGHCPGISPMSACPEHSLIIQAETDDANALYEEFRAKGVDVSEPEDKPWGLREFGVVSPDGHRFMFTQRLETIDDTEA